MKQLTVYLNFPGTCREALDFYKDCLDGEIISVQTFGEAPMQIPEDQRSLILHSEFKAEGVGFMASDTMPGETPASGSQISLTLTLDALDEQEKVFRKLSDGGKVTMPLEDTFWGARFGMLTDKYGINWMLNCDKK